MKLGKVIGNVVSSIKDPGLHSLRLLVVQGLDDNLEPNGNPYVAADGISTAGPGDIVYVVSKKEAALVFSKDLIPIDECIVGFVEEHFVTKRAKRKVRKKKAPPPTIPLKEPQTAKTPKKTEFPPDSIKESQDGESKGPPKTKISPVSSKKQPKKTPIREKKSSKGVSRQTKTVSRRRKSK